ncbi:hypothetical protein JoomaDRAFT_1447 [Galbibacter orientalis DSM 19592]|uniref:Uncharacterized protein n=1 Tax=Galbibacter orientalis DSM 19592 TaxID=926559 RepID=I3C4B9_9FLAO|nr:hypothetical protein [Galbibacter orientalis]EIJ38462.1 hypothetical protein JoomaDRAFT_1447 [Galbibacter orientalis DSM 19592]
MQKLIFYIIFLAVVKGFGQKLEFNPKKDHQYPFETELVVFNTSRIDLALKTIIGTTFLKNKGYRMKVDRFQVKSPIFTVDSDNPESLGQDSTKVREIISKPFIFIPEEGTLKLVSHTGIDDFDKIQEALKEFGKYHNPSNNKLYEGIVLKKGYSWSVTDSISSEFLNVKSQVVTYDYTVKNITRKEVILYGKSVMEKEYDTTNIAVKYVLDKKTGIPLYTKFVSHENDDVSVFMINRVKNYHAPDMFEEFMTIEPDLYYSSYMKYSSSDNSSIEYEYQKPPLITDREKLEKTIAQSLDSLVIDTYPGRENSYYLSGYLNNSESVMDSLLAGAYSKVNSIQFYDKNGKTINLKPDKNVPYYTPMYFGPYHSGLYQPVPKIEKVEIDITTFKPTKRKTVALNSNMSNTDYDLKIADSTVSLNFKKYMNIDYQSFRFFDKDGKELDAKWIINNMNENLATNGEAFTQKFIEQVPGKRDILYTMKFIVKNASKVTFAILTDDLKFRHAKTIERKTSSRP